MPALRPALALTALAVGGALFAAFASEWWGGLVPCALCLLGRWPYRIAVAAAVGGVLVPARWRGWFAVAVLAAMLGSVAIGAVHVGVELGWWPSPLPGCVARFTPGAGLPALPAKPCDEPTFLVPGLPISMAAMSLLFSVGISAFVGMCLVRQRRVA